MKNFSATKWVVLGVVALVAIHFFTKYNTMVGLEQSIIAKEKKARNSLATFTNTMKTELGIQDKYLESYEKAVKLWMEGRYGNKGAGALFQAIGEQNIPVSEAVFLRVMQSASSGYAAYEASQNAVVEDVRLMRGEIRKPLNKHVVLAGGFPTIDLDSFEDIVLNEASDKAYKTRKFEGIEVNPKK